MASKFRSALFPLCLRLLLATASFARAAPRGYYVPILFKINQKQTECLYDYFEKSDFVTYSAFVVEVQNNGQPKAKIQFEGPVAGNAELLERFDIREESGVGKDSLGRKLKQGGTNHWPRYKDADKQTRYDKRVGIINRNMKVDWTHAGEHEDAVAARKQIEQEKKEAYRNYGRGAPQRDDPVDPIKEDKFRTITQKEIAPYEETNAIKAPGWYRLCVTAEMHTLFVEMEIRSGNKLGGVDRKTGHVYTYEEREMLDEEKRLDEGEDEGMDSNTYKTLEEERRKILENQVKEQDLHATKAQIKHLNSMVSEMKKKHQEHQNRIKSHNAASRRNQDNMTWSSKLETVLYVLITGFQMYTVRRWLLQGNSLLGA